MYRALAELSPANCLKEIPQQCSTALQVVKLLCNYRTAADVSAKVLRDCFWRELHCFENVTSTSFRVADQPPNAH